MAYMLKGLTAQFTNRVNPTGLPLLPAWITSAKSIFTMIGYIMKNRQIAIGIDTTGASPTYIAIPSRVAAKLGAILPRTMPAPIHSATQRVRYFSKKLMPLPLAPASLLSIFLVLRIAISVHSRMGSQEIGAHPVAQLPAEPTLSRLIPTITVAPCTVIEPHPTIR